MVCLRATYKPRLFVPERDARGDKQSVLLAAALPLPRLLPANRHYGRDVLGTPVQRRKLIALTS